MSEAKDPKIKLFGKTIQLPENQQQLPLPDTVGEGQFGGAGPPKSNDASGVDSSVQDRPSSTNSLPQETSQDKAGEEQESGKELLEGELGDSKEKDGAKTVISEELSRSNANLLESEDSNAASADNDLAQAKTLKSDEEQGDNCKAPKKPDKILPCPRCNSMETKFCYFNNYNVNQPRHFCKNCQRYWTAGGTMRNVPVGAGRRKNKHSASQYRHIVVPEVLQNVRADLPNGLHHAPMNPNGTILAFGSDAPLCESMASVLNIAEKSMQNSSQNGFHQPEERRISVSSNSGDSLNDQSSGSSLTAGNSDDKIRKTGLPENVAPNFTNFPPQVPFFPGGPWPYPWNSVQWSSPVAPPGFCPPGFPMPFYPAAPYWGCNLSGTWTVPWVPPPITSHNPPPTSGPNSPTLGKHSREDNRPFSYEEEEPKKESNPEKCLWVPKTLRIDDPGEAARSSIWATLEIKNDKADLVEGGGIFKAFQSKSEEKTSASESSTVLQANPAALSRSLNFQESS